MGNGCSKLRFDVVTNDGDAAFFEPIAPVFFTCQEYRDAVDHTTPGIEDLLDVPFGGLFAADWEIVDDYINLAFCQDTCLLYTSDAADE